MAAVSPPCILRAAADDSKLEGVPPIDRSLGAADGTKLEGARAPVANDASASYHKMPHGVSPSSTMDLLPESPGARAAPFPDPLLESTSDYHALKVDRIGGVLVCGGSSMQEEGETFIAHLGLGSEWGAPIVPAIPLADDPARGKARSVAAGSLHSLILTREGAVWSCGAGWEGPLGHGNELTLSVPACLSALAAVPIEVIAAGHAHSLAISRGGALYSWGWGRFGQLGHGGRESVHTPRRVEAVAPPIFARQVAAGMAHTVVLCAAGRVYTFGQALHGQCGHGACGCHGEDVHDELSPKLVEALAQTRVKHVGATSKTTTAVTDKGESFAWGDLPGSSGCVPLPMRAPVGSTAPLGASHLPRIESSGAVADLCAVLSQTWEHAGCMRTAA